MDMYEIDMRFPDRRLSDISERVIEQLKRNTAIHDLPKQSSVAITAGSRGISHMPEILRLIVGYLLDLSLHPFLVPAMGSHGGATAEGQIEVLRHLGITETSIGAPIHSSMEVDLLGYTPRGMPVYIDRCANQANGIIVVNRIKAHTAFRGNIESGLSKMIAIGLGKITGASFIHSAGVLEMGSNIEEISKLALEKAPILLGIGILENGFDETADIVSVSPAEWHVKEAELLQESKQMLATLPADQLDLLLVEQMGKGFSGSGMDPNILGRWRISGVQEPISPNIKRVVVLDLAEHSNGNAQGIGLADFTTQTLVDKIDRTTTYTSTITSTFLQRAMLPMVFPTEREAFEAALRSLGPGSEAASIKCVQIPNTLNLDRVLVSQAVLTELQSSDRDFQVVGKHTLSFTPQEIIAMKLTKSY